MRFLKMQKRRCGNTYKTCRNEDFGSPFSKMAPKMIKQALPREGFRNTFSERRETSQNQWKTRFFKMQKRVANALIKPVEFQDFGMPFWEWHQK